MQDPTKNSPGPWGYRHLNVMEYPYAYYLTCGNGALGYLTSEDKHDTNLMMFQEADAKLLSASLEMKGLLEQAIHEIPPASPLHHGIRSLLERIKVTPESEKKFDTAVCEKCVHQKDRRDWCDLYHTPPEQECSDFATPTPVTIKE